MSLLAVLSLSNVLMQPMNVFEEDNRRPLRETSYPWSAIGKVQMQNGHCTGTLVAPDLVLTAAHCLYDEKGNPTSATVVFHPNDLGNGQGATANMTQHWVGARDYAKRVQADWALIRLDRDLGSKFGTMPLRNVDWKNPEAVKTVAKKVTLAGYSADFQEGRVAGVHEGCSIRSVEGDLLYHDCDSDRGSSGGALFADIDGGIGVIGINKAQYLIREDGQAVPDGWAYDPTTANIAVATHNFFAKFQELTGAKAASPGPNGNAAPATNDKTRVEVCNRSGGDFDTAFVYRDSKTGSWKSMGWFAVKAKSCRWVVSLPASSNAIRFRVEGSDFNIGAAESFCVNPKETFAYTFADDERMCRQVNGKYVAFSKERTLQPGQPFTYTIE
jgi:V8-like Glu-specific endopeptidase